MFQKLLFFVKTNKLYRSTICLCFVFLSIIFNSNAQTIPNGFKLVAYEGFNYSSGTSLFNANGGTGWTNSWGQAYDQKYLKTGTTGFTYTGLSTTGFKADFDTNCYGGTCGAIAALKRSFPIQDKGVVYLQFISVFEATGTGGTPTFRLFNTTTLTGGIGNNSGGSVMSILNAGLSNLSSSSASLSAQNLVVVRIDYNLNKTEMWINPNLSTFNYLSPTSPAASAVGFSPIFDRIDLFMRSGSIDEITVFKQVDLVNRNGKITNITSSYLNKSGAITSTGDGVTANGNIYFGLDGLTAPRAGSSASQIKTDYPLSPDGVYWINVPGYGPKQTYCLMNSAYDGGGWMLALKATTGTTFNYDANYWTTANTLNPADVTRNNADAKYDVMNGFLAKDIMALWPDISNIGAESGSIDNLSNWSWLQNNFHSGSRISLISKLSAAQTTYYTNTNGSMTFSGYNSAKFSNQGGFTFYGINYTGNAGAKVRWGFAWNNETDQSTNDVSGGIGMSSAYGNFSAGDKISCCETNFGINRSARVEIFIR